MLQRQNIEKRIPVEGTNLTAKERALLPDPNWLTEDDADAIMSMAHSNRPAAEATASKTCCVKTASPWSVHLLPFARRQLRKLDLDVRLEAAEVFGELTEDPFPFGSGPNGGLCQPPQGEVLWGSIPNRLRGV